MIVHRAGSNRTKKGKNKEKAVERQATDSYFLIVAEGNRTQSVERLLRVNERRRREEVSKQVIHSAGVVLSA